MPTKREEYGLLLVKQEELGEQADKLIAELKAAAKGYKNLGHWLEQVPESVAFVNGPIDLKYPDTHHFMTQSKHGSRSYQAAIQTIDWQTVDVNKIAEATVRIKHVLAELYENDKRIKELKDQGLEE